LAEIPDNVLHRELGNLITEAIKLRMSIVYPDVDAEFVDIHSSLIECQTALTSMEMLLSMAIRSKAKLDRQVFAFKLNHQELWDRAISKPSNRVSFSEYATGKEKAAEANLATLNSARDLRKVEDSQAFALEAVEVIRLHYYGLDKVRQDLRKRLEILAA
jgi:hypothetical protein